MPELIREPFAIFSKTGDFGDLMRAAGRACDAGKWFEWYQCAEFLGTTPEWNDFEHLVTGSQLLHFQSAVATDGGRRLPMLNGFGQIEYLELDARAIDKRCGLDEYWRRQPCWLRMNWGLQIDGADIPVDPVVFSDQAATFPRADDLERVAQSTDALLDEAVRSKQWTIPAKACVQLSIGPFTELSLTEIRGDVTATIRTANREFYFVNVEPAKKYWDFRPLFREGFDATIAESICAGIKLLLAAVIRDFWVIERRETAFSVREVRSPVRRGSASDDKPRIVYLPRIRYAPRADVERCASELGQPERREHQVAAHLRKAARSSAAQVELARLYGFSIPQGYTFVRPHDRGGQRRDVVYRSRSALQSLYTIDETVPELPSQWFEFERDVRGLLMALGFEVEHIAASGRGDRGVDVYARKGRDLEEVCWVIQCKCWSPSRKVGPDVVRDLVGALTSYPAGTRGMVVTTSAFTSGAIAEAERVGVKLMDGEEFVSLRQQHPPA